MKNKLFQFFKVNKTVILAIFLYCIVSYYLITLRKDFWYDELFTLEVVKSDFQRAFNLMIGDGKPLLYYVLVKLYAILGNSTSVIFLRTSSILLGIPFIIYSYKLIREFIKNNYSVLLLFVLILNPFFLAYSTEFRMYTMLPSATVIYFYYFYKSVICKDSKYSKRFNMSKVLLLLTSYLGIFTLFAELLYKILDKRNFDIKAFIPSIVNIKSIFTNFKKEILFLIISSILIFLQITIFLNFNPSWVAKVSIESFGIYIAKLFLGTDPSIVNRNYPEWISYLLKTGQYNTPIFLGLLFITILFFILIIKLYKRNNKVLQKLFFLPITTLFIIIFISLPIFPLSFFQDRYLIGIFLSLLLTLGLLAYTRNNKTFFILCCTLLITNVFSILAFATNIYTFQSPSPNDSINIKFYFTEEINRCGVSIFDKYYNNCIPVDDKILRILEGLGIKKK